MCVLITEHGILKFMRVFLAVTKANREEDAPRSDGVDASCAQKTYACAFRICRVRRAVLQRLFLSPLKCLST